MIRGRDAGHFAGSLSRLSRGRFASGSAADPGMPPVVVGAGVGLDLDPEDAGRDVGDVRERLPGPAAGATHRVERAKVDDYRGARLRARLARGSLPHATCVARDGHGRDGPSVIRRPAGAAGPTIMMSRGVGSLSGAIW
jgi:hypothetical protein